MRVALAALLLAGCDVVFGLERPPVDSAPDQVVSEHRVVVELGLTEILQLADGQLESRFVGLSSLPRVKLDDGTEPTVTPTTTGFEFMRARPDQQYRFAYEIFAGADVSMLVAKTERARIVQPVLGRIERTPVAAGTIVSAIVNTTQPRNAWAVSTGLRTTREVNVLPNQLANFSYDWSTTPSQSGPIGLPLASMGDRLHLLEYTLAQGWYEIATIRSGPLTLAQGQSSIVALLAGPTLSRTCLELRARRARDLERIEAAAGNIDFPDSRWIIAATPEPAQLPGGGIPLAYENTSPDTDPIRLVGLWNPFAPEKLIVEMTSTASVMLDSTTRGSVGATTYALVPEIPLPCNGALTSVVIEGATGFATGITLDGAPITASMPNPEGRLAWTVSAGDADMFLVRVLEIGGRASPIYVTNEPALVLEPDTFEPGQRYYVQITAISGRPDADTGDFSTSAYPQGHTVNVSPAFAIE
jgi:hypothetical protein